MALGVTEILIIAGTAIFLFGGAKVVAWAKNLGQAKAEFEKASKINNDTKM